MIRLTENDWRLLRRLQRKHNVSTEFLRYNLENIEKFIWFETWPRIVIRRYAIRKENRVFIIHYRLRRVLFDQANRKIFKRMRQNIKQWSKRIVAWQKNHFGVNEYVEEVMYEEKSKEEQDGIVANTETPSVNTEDVSIQLKEQLELLKNGRRSQSFTNPNLNVENINSEKEKNDCIFENDVEKQKCVSNSVESSEETSKERLPVASSDVRCPQESAVVENQSDECSTIDSERGWQVYLESTPEKQITTQENIQPVKQLDTDEKTEKSHTEANIQHAEKLKTGLNFLDMLMCKVGGNAGTNTSINNTTNYNAKISPTKEKESLQRMSSSTSSKEGYQHHHEHSMDSTDEFLGFDDCERIPGMLMTPIVPHSTKNNKNSVFVSESLNEYMRLNDLETNYSIDEDKSVIKGKIFARNVEGLMTPNTKPPYFDMPAVPENLLKFRTVAERKQYLQKFSKNYRLAIINNEASIYRELQRRMRTQKVKCPSQIVAQSSNSLMSFTRNGWNAASFINTEFNKYYYQILDVDHGTYKVQLRGARGNNNEFRKIPYTSRVIKPPKECFDYCADDKVWQYLKPIKTIAEKTKKLNRNTLPSVFKPCPLSHKKFQKPLDDDTAALLLAGGSMAVVRMPTVELEVYPEYGKPLHEIAKRYLQYILPHHDISREWAEFSVSTLQQPKTLKEAEQAAAKSFKTREMRRSYTFVIPYLNDRNHILVRRVVDRSEKLDESFEHSVEDTELVPKNDFTFRKNLDLTDDVLLTCADVVSDMINTVAISCSENSFIKIDPDGLNAVPSSKNKILNISKHDLIGLERPVSSSPNNAAVVSGGIAKKYKKQNSLLLELKRLNATIINAAVKPEKDKNPCSKEYCQMGCICLSLKEITPIREHCGKSKCMLECTCKSSNQSRIMRLETDGRTLTTEDAFMLRRKATARLARMEKEFTSTVVLTENETLLINETNNDKKRRCTKAPKRYEDFTDTEDEQRRNSPKKTALTTIDKEKHLAIEIKELHDPVYVKDSIFEQLKHCTVNLVPLQDMDNVAPWCMVHNLYKCFCKGRSLEGKPLVIEKEEVNTTIEHNDEQKLELDLDTSGKPKYIFDKEEISNDNDYQNGEHYADKVEDFDDEEAEEKDDRSDDDWIKERKRKYKEDKDKRAEKQKGRQTGDEDSEQSAGDYTKNCLKRARWSEKQKPKRNLHDVRKRFYTQRLDSCRRHIPTPRRMFLYCNRRRRLGVLKYIKDNENDQTRLLLNEHVMRSVYYHKTDAELQKNNSSSRISKEKFDNTKKSNLKVKKSSENLPQTEVTKSKFLLVNEVVDLLEDDDDEASGISNEANKHKDENSQLTSSSTQSCSPFEKLLPDTASVGSTNHFQICSSGGVITVKKFAGSNDHNSMSTSTTTDKRLAEVAGKEPEKGVDGLKLPKIASCFSLNAKANIPNVAPNEGQPLDFTSATSVHSAAFSQNQGQQNRHFPIPLLAGPITSRSSGSAIMLDMDNDNVRDVYNNVIKTMNSLVSKKMQDIDCALQRESHIIPTPNADILCIMKWSNFLDAFSEGFSYVWQVKMKDLTFFAITIQNVMPLVVGAMGIVNITALKAEKLPLMGRMLLHKFRNKESEKLAVVMQGKQSHWVVKGFLKADPTMACNKPTPGSHPSLTKKINVLCSLLVKQRQKDHRKKEKAMNQWTKPQTNPTTQANLTPPVPLSQPPSAPPKIAQIMPTRRVVTIQPRPQTTPAPQNQNPATVVQQQQPTVQPLPPLICQQTDADTIQKFASETEMDSGNIVAKMNIRKRKIDNVKSTSVLKMDSFSKMSSNIEFRSVTQSDIDEIFLPELHKLDHKWLVLDLHNDFSHIFVPDFRDLVSLDRIQKVINFARQKSKIVKLQFFQNAPFDAFVTPKSVRKIYFGPLTTNMKSPTLILLQSVDGQMMLRELYQLQHNIVKKPEEKTKAFWLVHIKGQTHFEMDKSVANGKTIIENIIPTSSTNTSVITDEKNIAKVVKIVNEKDERQIVLDDDDDEDCIIIDDTEQKSVTKETSVNMLPQQSSLATTLPIAPPLANNLNSPSQSLLKVPNTNTIIKPLSSASISGPVLINVPLIPPTSKPLPLLTLPPNTIITGITPPSTISNATVPQNINQAQSAIITTIEAAPADAPYSSTIFITSSASPSVTSIVSTTTSAAINNCATTISNAIESNRVAGNEMKSVCIKQPTSNIMKQALGAGAIKRRRISLFCSNKYDKISENLAVDAVIKKILPDNAEDIQISPLGEEDNASSNKSDVVATVGSTKISKVSSNIDSNILQTVLKSGTNKPETTIKSKAPIVFDVNFMDDGDEPTASIVIKPTSSTATSLPTVTETAKTQVQTQGCNTTTLRMTPTNTSIINSPVSTAPTVPASTNPTTLGTAKTTFSEPATKIIRLPTLFNATSVVTSSTNTNTPGKGKLINSYLCTKQPNIVPQFSTPKPVVSKLNSSCLSSPSVNNPITATFPFRRPSISVKVVSSSVATTSQPIKPITTTATITTNQTSYAPTLTVKQVQDMLNKPRMNVTAINSISPSSVGNLTQSRPLQLLPTIKATITPAKATAVSAASTPITLASSNSTALSGSAVSSTLKTIKPSTTPAHKKNLSNQTLAISKVQSFGSPQKPKNSGKNLKTFISPSTQVVINDLSDKVRTPTPPAHIQYGHIVSAAYENQKFVAKRVAEEFYIKVPSVGILKLQGLLAVNNYLNKHIGKFSKGAQTSPVIWQFMAASKDIQVQNYQKALLVRKKKNNTGAPKNNSFNKSLEEPILIDD